MKKKAKGINPSVSEWVDYTDNLGLIEPEELIEAAREAGEFVFDLETTGLSPREDRITGIAFYVPPTSKRPEIQAWFPFVPNTYLCHVRVKDLPKKYKLFESIGVDTDQIRSQIKGLKPDDLTLVDARPPMPQEETMNRLRPIWEELTDTVCIAHNIVFDNSFILLASGTNTGIKCNNIWSDSMLADFCSDETRYQYGLKVRVKQEFGYQMTTYEDAVKGQSLLPFCNAQPLGSYALSDCYWTYRLHQRSLQRLREQSPVPPDRKASWTIEKQLGRPLGKLERVYWGIDTKVAKIIMEMQNAGVLIDWRHLRDVEERLRKQKTKITERIERFLGWPLNPNSSPQVADALFAPPPDGLGLPQAGIPVGKTGVPSTADKVIKHFSRFHPLVADILKWRSLDTVLTSFVIKLIKLSMASPDGRIYAKFKQTGTVIGRLSSKDPINLQNQPRKENLVRKAYVAYREGIDEPDLVMLGGDYCLSYDTKVETPCGIKTIEELRVGDLIYSWNTKRREVEEQKIEAKIDVGEKRVWRVVTDNGSVVRGSNNHRLYRENGERSAIRFLSPGDTLLNSHHCTLTDCRIRSIARTDNYEQMYDIQVSEHHNFVLSNGIVSSNSQIELRTAAHLANEESMIQVYSTGGICNEEGGACDRYLWYECKEENCDYEGPPIEFSRGVKSCPKCGNKNPKTFKHQASCRHVDLHQKTAEDVNVKRNPLAKNCITGDALILTEHGLLRMDEVVTEEGRVKKTIGIMSDDGRIRPTESTWGGGNQPVADVHMEYGLKVTATYDHKFYVMREGKVEQIPVEDLKPGDPVLIMAGRDIHGKDIELPQVEVDARTSYKDVELPSVMTAEVARFLGYVVSEGRYETSPGRYQFWIGVANYDLDMHTDLERCIEAVIPDRLCRISYEKKTVFSLASKSLNAWLEVLGVGGSFGTKAIPASVRRAPWAIKREFFRALFEGDGTSKTSGEDDKCRVVSYTSKSETLIRQIQAEMLNINILGYVSSETRPTKKGRQRYWAWTIRRQSDLARFAEMVGFISKRKQERLERLLIEGITDRSNRFLDGVEPLLETICDKVKRKQKDKLREVIRREKNPVRFDDTRVQLLANVLPEEITKFVDAGIWTAKVQKIEDAGEAEVFDVYEPERTAMVVNSCVILDCNFGLLYRMGAPKFCIYADLFDADGMPMVAFAKELIESWHNTYPAISDFHEKTEWMLEKNNWVAETLFGRRRRLSRERRINHFRAVTQGIQFQVSGCVVPETPVLTESGYVPIFQLVEARTPIFDGIALTKNYSVFETGEKEVFEVRLSDGRTLRCSSDHRLAGIQGLNLFWPRVANLKEGDLVATYDAERLGLKEGPQLGWTDIESIRSSGTHPTYDIEIHSENHAYVANGFLTHNSAQDIMKAGMIRVIEERDKRIANSRPAERKAWKRLRIISQVHDEILCECDLRVKDEACVMVKEAMESIGRGYLRVPLAFDVTTGKSWEDVH